jgi:hypothetical protein
MGSIIVPQSVWVLEVDSDSSLRSERDTEGRRSDGRTSCVWVLEAHNGLKAGTASASFEKFGDST